MELTDGARRRGLAALLVGSFFSAAGFFGVIPLIAIHYVDDLGWTAGSVGLVLAVRQFTQQGLSFFSGMLADRWGAKWLIVAGMLVRVAGFALMGVAESYTLLLLSAVVVAFGGGLFESPTGAAIATLTEEQDRRRYYALSGTIGGFGTVFGTQAGALLIRADFTLVALAGASCFFVLALATMILLPPVQVATEVHGIFQGAALAVRDRTFMSYMVLMMGYWFMWTQVYAALPLMATAIAGTASAVAWVYGVNSAATLILGVPLPRVLERRLAPVPMLIVGIGITAVGLAGIGWVSDVPTLLACVFAFSIGSILVRPASQTVTADLANPAARGSYYGVNALSLAIGGGIGNYAGGVIYDVGDRSDQPALPWLVFASIGLITAIGLLRIRNDAALTASAPARRTHPILPVRLRDSKPVPGVLPRKAGEQDSERSEE